MAQLREPNPYVRVLDVSGTLVTINAATNFIYKLKTK